MSHSPTFSFCPVATGLAAACWPDMALPAISMAAFIVARSIFISIFCACMSIVMPSAPTITVILSPWSTRARSPLILVVTSIA